MEYIVGLIALAAVIYLVTRKKEEVAEVQPEVAPYKVEAVNAQPIVETTQAEKPAAPKKAPAKKPATKAKAPAKKPATKKPAAKTAKPKA